MPIDADEVKRIATLAKLELDAREVERYRNQLQSILDHVALLDEIHDADAEPSPVSDEASAPPREDRVVPGLGSEGALKNAPDAGEGHFRVPRVLGE